jgi:hypothetical protein
MSKKQVMMELYFDPDEQVFDVDFNLDKMEEFSNTIGPHGSKGFVTQALVSWQARLLDMLITFRAIEILEMHERAKGEPFGPDLDRSGVTH